MHFQLQVLINNLNVMDVKAMMSQMQNQFAKTQAMLEKLEVEAKTGGEEGVFMKMDGKFKVIELKINFMPKDADDLSLLEDLIKNAINQCTTEIEQSVKKFAR
jgi:DNA-binding protein YbaB